MTRPPRRHRRGPGRAGFTLVELAVVAVMIGIFAAMTMPLYRRAVEQAKADLAAANLRSIQAAMRFRNAYNLPPRSIGDLRDTDELIHEGVIASDEDALISQRNPDYTYEIVSDDPPVVRAVRMAGSASGTLTIDADGLVRGSILLTNDPASIRPARLFNHDVEADE